MKQNNEQSLFTGDIAKLYKNNKLKFNCPLCQREYDNSLNYFVVVVDHNKHVLSGYKDNG